MKLASSPIQSSSFHTELSSWDQFEVIPMEKSPQKAKTSGSSAKKKTAMTSTKNRHKVIKKRPQESIFPEIPVKCLQILNGFLFLN